MKKFFSASFIFCAWFLCGMSMAADSTKNTSTNLPVYSEPTVISLSEAYTMTGISSPVTINGITYYPYYPPGKPATGMTTMMTAMDECTVYQILQGPGYYNTLGGLHDTIKDRFKTQPPPQTPLPPYPPETPPNPTPPSLPKWEPPNQPQEASADFFLD